MKAKNKKLTLKEREALEKTFIALAQALGFKHMTIIRDEERFELSVRDSKYYNDKIKDNEKISNQRTR